MLFMIPLMVFSQEDVKISSDTKILKDVHYNKYKQTTFDLYLPAFKMEKMPLVVFFHGGSFIHGDKSEIENQIPLISSLLEKGIAFASVNYRYRVDNDSLGVMRCIKDAADFVRFIRFHNDKYNIDSDHIGCYGESAGAGISLFLAFHEEMAVPSSEDSLLRESTRIRCAGAVITQATYNLYRWKKFIPCFRLIYLLKKKTFKQQTANFYGFSTYKEFKPLKKEITEKLDMLNMITPDDPPVWLCNIETKEYKRGIPHNEGQIFHHPRHAEVVGKEAKKNGVANYVITSEKDKKQAPGLDDFFERYLK